MLFMFIINNSLYFIISARIYFFFYFFVYTFFIYFYMIYLEEEKNYLDHLTTEEIENDQLEH